MKLIDFDGMFDEKLAVYMEENQGKYKEKEWVLFSRTVNAVLGYAGA